METFASLYIVSSLASDILHSTPSLAFPPFAMMQPCLTSAHYEPVIKKKHIKKLLYIYFHTETINSHPRIVDTTFEGLFAHQ
jgi:hypothetical protein